MSGVRGSTVRSLEAARRLTPIMGRLARWNRASRRPAGLGLGSKKSVSVEWFPAIGRTVHSSTRRFDCIWVGGGIGVDRAERLDSRARQVGTRVRWGSRRRGKRDRVGIHGSELNSTCDYQRVLEGEGTVHTSARDQASLSSVATYGDWENLGSISFGLGSLRLRLRGARRTGRSLYGGGWFGIRGRRRTTRPSRGRGG